MNTDACTGLITIATNNDDSKHTINVIGMYFMKSPTIPGKNNNGANEAIIVRVAIVTGNTTSRGPSIAAS